MTSNATAPSPTASDLPALRPKRTIQGASAIVLPMDAAGAIDWPAFDAHVARTAAAGLIPAVNMDTGYGHLLDPAEQLTVLDRTKAALGGGEFFAGTVVKDKPGDPFNGDAYASTIEAIEQRGGVPVIYQTFGMMEQPNEHILASYKWIGARCERFIGFELGKMFAPFGGIYSLELYREIIMIPACTGLKHSSLSRQAEWDRLAVRDEVRPEFRLYTGNDLAIDMVMYGSDYLLGLSTFAPDAFALRDGYWAAGDARFYELNDVLQYLGAFAFRDPTPAYKHDAAMFLHERGWAKTDKTHPQAPTRPASDREVLAAIWRQLQTHL